MIENIKEKAESMKESSEFTQWHHIIDAMLAFTCNRVNRGSVSDIIVGGLEVFLELPGSKVVSLFLVNEDSYDFQYSNSVPEGTSEPAKRQFKLLVDNGIIATALNSGQATYYNSSEGDQRSEDMLVIPLVGPKGVIGVVLVTLGKGDRHLEHMLLRLCLLHSYQFASVLYSARVFRKLKNEKTVLKQKIAARTHDVEFEKRELRTMLDSIPAGPLPREESMLTSQNGARELHNGIMHERMRSETFRVLSTFTRHLSHDLANIFNNISGYSYLVKKNLNDPQKIQKYIDTIELTAQKGNDLTLRLKNMVVEKRGRAKEVALSEIIRVIIKKYRDTITNRVPTVDSYGNPLRIFINPKDFKKIIELLVEDIHSRYTSENVRHNEINVDISARLVKRDQDIDPAIFPPSDHKGDYVQISLRYSTSPLDDTVLQSIFDPYAQMSRDGEQNGLKLSMAYALMQRYGGTILCEVEATTGNVYKILVPAAQGRNINHSGIDKGKPGYLKEATIFLVDDEKAMRDLGQEVLQSEGYKVMVAEDGKQAVEIYKDNYSKIDLVILDLRMPVMDGRQAYVEMKELNPDMKAFFCTAYTSDEDILSLIKSENLRALKKPFNLDQFLGLINEILLQ